MTADRVDHILKTLRFLHPGGEVFEVRVIGPKQATSNLWEGKVYGQNQVVAGWFRDQEKAAGLAVQVQAKGVYVTLNPCQEALLARVNERLIANFKPTTSDTDITSFRNFLIDIDPKRPAEISSTDEEHARALAMAEIIREDLAREGWPEPLVGDSGNGAHLIYAVNQANIQEVRDLRKGVLAGLAERYSQELEKKGLEIDQKVFNAARITKLYGTQVAKGENLPERPHRLARILSLPAEPVEVSSEILQKMAVQPAGGGGSGARVPPPDHKKKENRLDVSAYLQHYGVEVVKVKAHGSSILFCLKECVFDSSHEGNEAAIGQTAEGKLFYFCFHNSCQGRTWAEAREIISGQESLKIFYPRSGESTSKKPKAKKPPPIVEGGFHLSDLGNAKRLVARHGQDLRYCHLRKKWFFWTGKNWSVDDSGEVFRRAKETVGEMYRQAADLPENDREALGKFAIRSESRDRIAAMINLAQSEPGIPISPGDMDSDPWLFNCPNGTVKLQTGTLRPHARDDLITRLSPVPYEPEAEAEAWEKFLFEIQEGNWEVVTYLMRALGYAMTGSCQEQCFFILWGRGANGKTTLIETVQYIFGNYHANTPAETFLSKTRSGEIPADVARLDGPRLVTASEVDKGRRLSESLVKEITGQDTVTARFLYGDFFDYIPQFKLFLRTNNKPIIRGTDNAIWRRVKPIPFPVNLPEEKWDKNLKAKFIEREAQGILAWLVRGCLGWQEQGLKQPNEVTAAISNYRSEMDVLQDFMEDRCLKAAGAWVAAGELYEAYCDWAEGNGIKERERLKQRTFGMALSERGFIPARTTNGRRGWLGIGLRDGD